MRDNKALKLLKTFMISITGGFVYYFLHLPLPWMLGPLTALLLWKLLVKTPLLWPNQLRNLGLGLLGYLLGSTFTREILWSTLQNLPYMFIATVSIIVFSICTSYYLSHVLDISFPSALIGNMPGGFSQMVLLGEELESVDTTTVTVMQTLRLIVVMFTVPFLTIYGLHDGSIASDMGTINQAISGENTIYYSSYFIYALVILVSVWIACKIGFPTAFLIGALLGTATLVLMEIPKPVLPSQLFIIAQLCIATYLGLSIETNRLTSLKKLGLYTILSSILLVLFALLLSFFFSIWLSIPLTTAFLSLAPGGIPEMAIIGKEIRADISIITSYQLFRLFFILFIVPPILKWWLVKDVKLQKSV